MNVLHHIHVTSDILESSPFTVNINHVSLYLRCIEVSTTTHYKTHLHALIQTQTNIHPISQLKQSKLICTLQRAHKMADSGANTAFLQKINKMAN